MAITPCFCCFVLMSLYKQRDMPPRKVHNKRKYDNTSTGVMTRSKKAETENKVIDLPEIKDTSEIKLTNSPYFKCGHTAFLLIANYFVHDAKKVLDYTQKLLEDSIELNGVLYMSQLYLSFDSIFGTDPRFVMFYYKWETESSSSSLTDQVNFVLSERVGTAEDSKEEKQITEQVKKFYQKEDPRSEEHSIQKRPTCKNMANFLLTHKSMILLFVDARFLPKNLKRKKKLKTASSGHYVVVIKFSESLDSFYIFDQDGQQILTFPEMRYLRRATEQCHRFTGAIFILKNRKNSEDMELCS